MGAARYPGFTPGAIIHASFGGKRIHQAESPQFYMQRSQNESPPEWGTYHYCNLGQISWYRFAQKIFDLARPLTPLAIRTVKPVPTSAYPTPAKRPANSVLDCRKIEQAFGVVRPPWEESLEKMLREIIVSKKDATP